MASTEPLLSILIPSVPSRVETMLIPLLAKLHGQIEQAGLNDPAISRGVEVLTLLDNKKRSIGLKRDALLRVARGFRVAFVDDDDDVSPDYVSSLWAAAPVQADVVTFDQLCLIDDLPPVVIEFRLGNENETVYHDGRYGYSPHACPVSLNDAGRYLIGARRNAWHVCAWRRDIAQRFSFPDSMYGEDWEWAKQCCTVATTQHVIPKILHTYRFRSSVTEAIEQE